MSFGRPRYSSKCQWELLRYAVSPGVQIIGGAEKLFKHFVDDLNPDSIISYCDLAKFSGNVYERLGFKLDHVTQPNKIWSKDTHYFTNNLLLARGADQLLKTNYGKGTSNEDIMHENGWLSLYDCGQSVYIWKA